MADDDFSGSVLEALTDLGEQVLEAHSWATTAVDLAGDAPDAPSWPYLLVRQIARIDEALVVLSQRIYASHRESSSLEERS